MSLFNRAMARLQLLFMRGGALDHLRMEADPAVWTPELERLGRIVEHAYRTSKSLSSGRPLEYQCEGARVKVKSGWSRRYGCNVTSIVITSQSWPKRYLVVLNDEKQKLFDELDK